VLIAGLRGSFDYYLVNVENVELYVIYTIFCADCKFCHQSKRGRMLSYMF
jgi:hypothetical protein